MVSKMDGLTQRVAALERNLAADVKTILLILQQGRGADASLVKQEIPEYENIHVDTSKAKFTFQRSVSEPKPICKSQQPSQILHRFASFNKAFDFDRYGESTMTEALTFKEKDAHREELTAPIAKLESLDELDLESPVSSPKKTKK